MDALIGGDDDEPTLLLADAADEISTASFSSPAQRKSLLKSTSKLLRHAETVRASKASGFNYDTVVKVVLTLLSTLDSERSARPSPSNTRSSPRRSISCTSC